MVLAAMALFAVSLGYGVVIPLLVPLAGAHVIPGGPDPALVSIVYAAYGAAKMGAQVPAGVWVDRSGPARVLRIALLLYCASLAAFLVPAGLGFFALFRAVEGLATGLVYPAVFAHVLLTPRNVPQGDTGKRVGIVLGIGSSGLLVGPGLASLLAPRGAWLPVLVALAFALAVTAGAFATGASAAPARASSPTLAASLIELVSTAKNPRFVGLMLPIAYNKLTFSAFQGLLPLYGAHRFGLQIRGISALFLVTGVAFGVAQPIGGALVDRLPPRRLVLLVTPPLLALLGYLAFAPTVELFAIAYAAHILCSSLIFVATMKHAARAFGTEDTYGGVFGVLATVTDGMTIVGPLVFINAYASLEHHVFTAMAAVGLLFIVGYVVLGRAGGAFPKTQGSSTFGVPR